MARAVPIVFVLLLFAGCGGPTTSVASLLSLHSVIQTLQSAVSSSISQADQAVQNNLKQADARLREALAALDRVIQEIEQATARQRETAAQQAFEAIRATASITESFSRSTLEDVNRALAGAAQTLDAIPFLNVPDIALAVSPYRLPAHDGEFTVDVYGYFPSASTIKGGLKVLVENQEVAVQRGMGKIFFSVPAGVASKGGTELRVTLQFPKSGWFRSAPAPVTSAIRVLHPQHTTFDLTAYKGNSAAWETFTVAAALDTNTDKGADVRPVVQASELITRHNLQSKYSTSGATFSRVDWSFGYGRPCECCPQPTGEFLGTTPDKTAVLFRLRAPHCSGRLCGSGLFGTYWCGGPGAGSNVEIAYRATISARLNSAPESIVAGKTSFELGNGETYDWPLDLGWTQVEIAAAYDDGFEKSTWGVVTVKKGVNAGNTYDWTAFASEENVLRIAMFGKGMVVKSEAAVGAIEMPGPPRQTVDTEHVIAPATSPVGRTPGPGPR